jgi:uncharacterized membrane protein YbhN (UPF0104 family)
VGLPGAMAADAALTHLRRHLLRIVNIAVLAVIVVLVARQIDPHELSAAIGDADVSLLVLAFVLNFPTAVLFVVRSHLVLLRLGYRVERRVLVPAMILGNVAGSLTPASTGELLRATALRGHARIPATDGVALVMFERAVSVYLMALGTGAAIAFVTLPLGPAVIAIAGALLLCGAPALVPSLLRLLPRGELRGRASFAAPALDRLNQSRDRLAWILDDRRLLAAWSAATAIILMTSAVQVWLLSRSVAGGIGPVQGWVAFGGSQLAGIASLLPFGAGAMDGSLAAILRRFGATFEQGAAAAVLLRLIITIPYGIAAILCYAYLQRLEASGGRVRDDATRDAV